MAGLPTPRKVMKNGKQKWHVRFTDAGKARRNRFFDTQREANSFIKNSLSVEEKKVEGPSVLFEDFTEAYLADCERGREGASPLEPVTVTAYRQVIDSVLNPFFADYKLGEITIRDVKDFRDLLLKEYPNRDTAKSHFNRLKAILKYAVVEEHIHVSPAAELSIKTNRRQKKKKTQDAVDTFTVDEMRKLIETASALRSAPGQTGTAWQRYYPLFMVLVGTGVRISECLGFTWENISDDWSSISVTQKVSQPLKGVDNSLRISLPKSEASYNRKIPLPRGLVAVLKEWQRISGDKSGLIFYKRDREPIVYSQLRNRMWLRLLKEAGVSHHGFHATRHFYASIQLARGTPVFAVSRMLGHETVEITQNFYGHLLPEFAEERAKIANVFDESVGYSDLAEPLPS